MNTENTQNTPEDLQVVLTKLLSTALQPKVNPALEILTIADAAAILKCKDRTVKHYLFETHELRYSVIGKEVRIRESDLVAFVDSKMKPYVHDEEVLS